MTTAMDQHHEIELKDAAQMVIGAGAIALPVAMSKDTWEIAEELQPSDIIGIACMSALLIGGFVYAAYFRGRVREHWPLLVSRVLVIYGLTVIVASLSLLLINQAPWLTDPTLALNQTVLVALPASFAATVVDHMS